MSSEPQVHDFSDRSLEKDFFFRPGQDGRPDSIYGLLTPSDPKIQAGDILLVSKNGSPCYFQVVQFGYTCRLDPDYRFDWYVAVIFATHPQAEPTTWRQMPPML
jgi:hypothetical protein